MGNNGINIGIIGTSISAKAHLNVFQSIPGVKVAGIAGRVNDKTRYFAQEFGISWCASSAEELIKSQAIDAIVIAVPPYVQAELAEAAFKRGKHVLCEKPLGVTINESRRVIEAWKVSGRVGMINFCYRLIPQIQEFKERLNAGVCGKVHSICAEWILSNRLNTSLTFHWKGQREQGGGVLQNFGTHVLDYLFYDDNFIKVLGAKQGVFIPIRYDDKGSEHVSTGDEVTTAMFDTGKGIAVTMHLSLVTMPSIGHRVIARGSKGTLEVRNPGNSAAGPFSLWFYGKDMRNPECLSEERCGEQYNIERLFKRVDSCFIKAIQNNDLTAEPSLESGIKAVMLVDEIQRAASSGQ